MANEVLHRECLSAGNRKVFTWSSWIKCDKFTGAVRLWSHYFDGGSAQSAIQFGYRNGGSQEGAIRVFNVVSGGSMSGLFELDTLLRNYSGWFHLLVSVNTTLSTADDRIKIYINGVRQQPFAATYSAPAINEEYSWNSESSLNGNRGNVIGSYDSGSGGERWEGQLTDVFWVDGQALTPEVFGFYKDGNGYISAGSTQATDFRNGQWVPRTPREIKNLINDNGGFGVNGFYLPMNDSSNFGADFHTTPNSIITLKGEDLPQPRNGAPTTTDAYVSQLRDDPYAANLVLAMPLIVGGQDNGYGDYSADIKGSGTNKTVTATGSPSISGINSSLYYGSALVDYNSLSDYLTVSGSGNDFRLDPSQEDWTIEFWTNPYTRSTPRHASILLKGDATTNNNFDWRFYVGDAASIDYDLSFGIGGYTGDSVEGDGNQTNLSPDQWHHVCVEANNGILTKYLNGVAIGINTNPGSQTTNYSDIVIARADLGGAGDVGYVGAISDIRIYSGVAKYKGGFDVPKPYTPVGIATWRAVPDTCQNNFATLDPARKDYISSGNRSLSNGNLSATTITTGNASNLYASIGVSTGKWYAETYISAESSAGVGFVGVSGLGRTCNENSLDSGEAVFYYGSENSSNTRLYTYIGGYNSSTDLLLNRKEYGEAYSTGDFVGIGINANTGEINFYKNGVDQGVAYKFDTEAYPLFFRFEDGASSNTTSYEVNFGQNPTFAGNVSSAGTFTDANGVGLFKYQPPEGYLALCTKNLPEPSIKDPGDYFKTVLWTGKGSTGKKVTGVGFKPDLIWIKNRKDGVASSWHSLSDSVRNARLFPNQSDAEDSFKDVMSFDDDGFTLDYGSYVNTNNATYVGWCWKAGGPATFNTDGTIIPKVSVNRDAGFSIATWTGTSKSSQSIGHGLGKKPDFYIWKSRDNSRNWHVAHKGLPAYNYTLYLDTTGPQVDNDKISAEPDSSLIYPASSNVINAVGEDYVGYFWTEVEGFSRFGSYVGNGNSNGPFVYCGFKPAVVIIKWATGTDHWFICDSSRSPINPVTNRLDPSDLISEIETFTSMDLLSNGFKIRTSNGQINTSGGSFIFAAWAETPLKYANAK